MIVYSKTCLPCTNKLLWKKLKTFARENGLFIETRRTNRPEYQAEADAYEIEQPFVVHEKAALSLTEDLNKLL